MEAVLPKEVKGLSIGACWSPSLVELQIHDDPVQLYQKRLKQTSNKKVHPHEIQEGDCVPKRILSFQPDSKGKWMPNYDGSCAMILTTMDGNKHTRFVHADAVKNTLSKKQKAR